MSEQQAEQSGGETGSLGAGSGASGATDAVTGPAMDAGQAPRSVESPRIAPDQEAPRFDAEPPASDTPKAEMPKAEPFTVGAPKADAPKDSSDAAPKNAVPKTDAAKVTPARTDAIRTDAVRAGRESRPRELLIMSPREGSWTHHDTSFESRGAEPKPDREEPPAGNGGRRFAAMAAMLLLAVVAGAAGGAFATIGMSHLAERTTAAAPAANTTALEASVARIDADIVALKAGLEQTTKAGVAQFNKTSDRLERIEKAQAEPNAKLAKLGEAVEKLRAAAPAATTVASAAPKEVTGTVTAPAGAQALPTPQVSPAMANAGAPPKVEVGRLPTVDNWVLRDVNHGSALIEGRTGLYEVFAGDPVPGLGRVEAIRKQDGRWVVVTPRGLIVPR